MRPEDDRSFLKMCNLIFKTPDQTILSEDAVHAMRSLNIALKDIQNKPFEKFMQENMADVQKNK